jgi:hypothetical protein
MNLPSFRKQRTAGRRGPSHQRLKRSASFCPGATRFQREGSPRLPVPVDPGTSLSTARLRSGDRYARISGYARSRPLNPAPAPGSRRLEAAPLDAALGWQRYNGSLACKVKWPQAPIPPTNVTAHVKAAIGPRSICTHVRCDSCMNNVLFLPFLCRQCPERRVVGDDDARCAGQWEWAGRSLHQEVLGGQRSSQPLARLSVHPARCSRKARPSHRLLCRAIPALL